MYRPLIVGAVMALCAFLGWQANGLRLHAEMARREAAQADATAAAVKKAREEDNRRTNALLETLNVAHADLARALSDRDRARAASDSLQQRARAIAATCAGRAAPAGPGQAAAAAGDLLADVLGRIDQAAGDIAAHADRAVIAGKACESAYDSLGK